MQLPKQHSEPNNASDGAERPGGMGPPHRVRRKRGRTRADKSARATLGTVCPPGEGFRRLDVALLAGVVLFAFGLRLVYVLQVSRSPLFDHPTMDALYHDQWARALAVGERYMDGPYFRAPLYPAFLACIYKLTGGSYFAPRVVQALLSSLSCGLLFVIGRLVFSRTVGAVAGLAAASYWILIYFDGELLIPSLIVFLDLLLILLLLHAVRRPGAVVLGAAGLVLGLSAIARPNILLFAPAVAVWLLFLSRPRWPRGLARAACFSAGALVPVLPVTIRNYVVGHDLVLIASQGGVNFYIGNNPLSNGKTAVAPGTPPGWWSGYYATIEQAEQALGRKLKPSEVSRYYYRRAWEFIRDEPLAALRLTAHKLRLFWLRWEISNNKNIYFWTEQFTPVVRFLPLNFDVVGPLGILGLWLCRKRAGGLFPLWGFVLIYMVSVVMFFCTARYRVPVLAPLILLGTHSVFWLAESLRQKRWTAVRNAMFVLIPAALLVKITYGAPQLQHDAESYWRLAGGYERAGAPALALQSYRDALESYRNPQDPDVYVPENPFMLLDMAWLLSTTPRDDLRNGDEALELVDQAGRLLRQDHPRVMDTKAAALAELGDFDAAADAARQALAKAEELNWTEMFEPIRKRIAVYEAGQPWRGSRTQD
jgi:4-amino-4-deoxy-L-arabinose transferase-like glycosyltransferase